MTDEDRGTAEPTDDPPDDAMTDDTDDIDDDALEQADSETVTSSEAGERDAGAGEEEAASDDHADRLIDDDLRRKLNYALLAGLGFLALIAVVQFYFNMSSVINQWVTREFRSLFQALFNLVVLLVVGAAISRQVRRLAD